MMNGIRIHASSEPGLVLNLCSIRPYALPSKGTLEREPVSKCWRVDRYTGEGE